MHREPSLKDSAARLRFVAKAQYLSTYCDPSIPYMEASTTEDIVTYCNTRGVKPRTPRPRTSGNRRHGSLVIASKWRGVGDVQASTPPHTKHIASTT